MRKTFLLAFASVVGVGIALVLASSGGRQSLERGIALGIPQQKGSPLRLVSSTGTDGAAFDVIELRNEGTKTVRQVTLGVLIHPLDNPHAAPLFFQGQPVAVVLAPGQAAKLKVALVKPDELKKVRGRLAGGAAAEAGVLRVEFVDGTTWTYDARTKGRFRGHAAGQVGASSGLPRLAKPCGMSLSPVALARAVADPGGHYTCEEDQLMAQWCENKRQGRECTDHICEGPDPCPYQICWYWIDMR